MTRAALHHECMARDGWTARRGTLWRAGVRFARCGIALAALAFCSRAPAVGDRLVGAASNRHLWLALEPRGGATVVELTHHAADETSWWYRTQHTLVQAPAAIAARDDTVWIVMPPRSIAGAWSREVYTATVKQNRATGLYYTTPAGRFDMAPSLQGLGRLAGVEPTPQGLMALVTPAPSTATAIARPGPATAPTTLARPLLLRLEPGRLEWNEIALPAGFVGTRQCLLAIAGQQVCLLESVPGNPARCVLHVRRGDDDWDSTSFPLDFQRVRATAQVAGQAVLALENPATRRLDFAYLRPAGPLLFASAEPPAGTWTICGFADRLLLIEREGGDEDPVLRVRAIDPLTGAVHEAQAMTRQPLTAGRVWPLTVALGLALTIVMIVLLLAPRRGTVVMVNREQVLPAGRRAAALAIDLVLGAMPATLLLDRAPLDLLVPPMFSLDPGRYVPYLVMVCLASLIALPFELATRRSIGKAVMGGHIAASDGSRPPAWRVLVRGLMRLLVLAIPPLAAFALGHSHLQGLPDVAARTLVLRNRDEPTEVEPGD